MRCGGVIGKKGDASFAGFVDAHRPCFNKGARAPEPTKVGDLWVAHCTGCGDYFSTEQEPPARLGTWQGEVFGRIS